MARAENITFEEFRTRFSGEDSCRAELFRLRFPNGFICPKCGCTEYYSVRERNAFQCRACRRQTSVTAGTVMHRTHLPLTVWFWVIYLCATDKRGISTVQLSRTLGICYESAWYLLHGKWRGFVHAGRSLKTSPAARLSRSLTKLLRLAQKSNATAIRAIGTCLALRWTRKNMRPAICIGCTKPSAT